MYCEFFGLKTAPFNNTPDPRFFYNTPDHEEALASLIYAVEQRKGFVLVTGEVGSGKTLLSRLSLNRFNDSIQTAVLTNTRLTGREFLQAICREFELEVERDATAAELTHSLEAFLLKQYARDRLAVVILDEAQNLPIDSLEELRMLGNLEADDAKLLQVLILGQPELQDSFRSPALTQTYQRIFRTFHLGSLDRDLTAGYIDRRLEVAGLSPGKQIFDPDAVDAIFNHTGGIPRMINQICDNALLAAYSDSRKRISGRIINDVVKQMMSLNVPAREAHPHATLTRASTTVLPASKDTPPTTMNTSSAGMLERMADRLAAFEKELETIKQHSQPLDQSRLDEALDIEEVRRMRRDAADLLRNVTQTSHDAELHIQKVLAKARDTTQSTQQRAKDCAEAAEKENTRVQNNIREKLDEIKVIADGQEARITQVVSQGRSEIEAIAELRRQASDLFEAITSSQKESDSRLHEEIARVTQFRLELESRLEKSISDSSGISIRLESKVSTFLEEAGSQTSALRNQLQTLIGEVQSKGDASMARTTELLAQQRTDLDAARRSIDEFVARMECRSSKIDCESREILDSLKDQAKIIVDQIHSVRDRSVTRADEVEATMEKFLSDMETRFQSSHNSISNLASSAETEVRTACVSLQTAKEQILSEAEDSRWQAHELLDQTRKLLHGTQDQCGSLLEDLKAQINEQTENSERIWRANAENGSKALSELNEKLLVARKLTDHSRTELETLVRNATGELAEARGSLETNLAEQKAQIARLSQDAGAIKLDFQRHFDEARATLDGEIADHQEKMDTRISRMETETNERVRKIKAEIEEQCDESVGLVSEAMKKLGSRVKEAETGSKNRVDTLTAELAAIIRKHSERAAERVCDIAMQADTRMNQAHFETSKKVQSLQNDLNNVSESADRIHSDLAKVIDTMEKETTDCRGRFEKESQHVQRKLIQLIERNRTTLQAARSGVESLCHKAGETTESMQVRIEALKNEARSKVAEIGERFEVALAEAMAKTDTLRTESENMTTGFADRISQTRHDAETTLVEVEEATRSLRQHSKGSLAEVRSCLTQMNERADVLRHDLSHMGDDIRVAAETTTEQVQSAGERIAARIESLRESAQRDADANYERLSAIKQQVEKSSEQMRQNASKLLDQVQTGAIALREHSNELLDQARTGSEKLNESAADILIQAQTSAEQFREQAEGLLHHAELTATEVRGEIQTLQSQVSRETEQIQSQIASVKNDMAASRRDSAQISSEAAEAHKKAQAQSEQLILRAETVQKQSEALLAMPGEFVEEAKSQARALANMSKKISLIVENLKKESESAGEKKQALKAAGDQANDKLNLLKHHTERVGQLVGIIRQLYGTMDARIERLRGRLTQVDDLVRSVPREIESLRAAFDDSAEPLAPAGPPASRSAAPSSRSVHQQGKRHRTGATQTVSTSVPIGPASSPTRAVPPASPPAANPHSLGQLVQRNQELNTWLKEVVGEENLEKKIHAQSADRAMEAAAGMAKNK